MNNQPLVKSLVDGLNSDEGKKSAFTSKCLEVLLRIDMEGQIGPNFDGLDSTYFGYLDALAMAGLVDKLPKDGDTMNSIFYVRNEEGKKICSQIYL